MENIRSWGQSVKNKILPCFFGPENILDPVLAAYIWGGHVLVEDVPGTGKTLLAQALASAVGGKFRRISCTPDLFPSDILGVSIFREDRNEFVFRPGPILAHFVLIDEINRATPRTQSALLEVMAERQISVEGKTLALPEPFFIMATESPAESEGSFPLPEVQKDRFFISMTLGYPCRDDEKRILTEELPRPPEPKDADTPTDLSKLREEAVSIYLSGGLKQYILQIVEKSRTDNRLMMGVSPRGSLALYKGSQALAALKGRTFITPEDIKAMAFPVLRKRILVKPELKINGLTSETVLSEYLSEIPVPLDSVKK